MDNEQVEVFLCPHHEGIEEEYRYSCTHSWPWRQLDMSSQSHALADLPPGKSPGTHWIGGWVCLRAGPD